MNDVRPGSRASARAAGLALALVALAGGITWPAQRVATGEPEMLPAAGMGPPARYLELVTPGLFAGPQERPPVMSLTRRAFLDDGGADVSAPIGELPLYAGLIPLLLALTALLSTPLVLLIALPAAVLCAWLAAGAGSAGFELLQPSPHWVLATVALAGGWGLARLVGRPDRVTSAMGLAVVTLVVTATLIIAALQTGAAPNESALAVLLERAPAADAEAALARPRVLQLNADHLRTTLDAAALSAFGALCVLLWFLKRRDGLAATVVVLAAAIDVGWRSLAA